MVKAAPLLRQAEAEVAEVRSWTCASCDTMVEDGSEDRGYCRSCDAYWRDVGDGLFDD